MSVSRDGSPAPDRLPVGACRTDIPPSVSISRLNTAVPTGESASAASTKQLRGPEPPGREATPVSLVSSLPTLSAAQRSVSQALEAPLASTIFRMVEAAVSSIKSHVDARKLYVMFEPALNCDCRTDHLTPKSVLPIFEDFFADTAGTLSRGLHSLLYEYLSSVMTASTDDSKLRDRVVELETEARTYREQLAAVDTLFRSAMCEAAASKTRLLLEIQRLREQVFARKNSSDTFVADFEKVYSPPGSKASTRAALTPFRAGGSAATVRRLESAIEGERKQAGELRLKISKLETELYSQHESIERIPSLLGKISSLERKILDYEARLDAIDAAHGAQIYALLKEEEETTFELSRLQAKIKSSDGEVQTSKRLAEELNRRLIEKNKVVEQMHRREDAAEAERLRHELAALAASTQQMQQELDKDKSADSVLSQKLENIHARIRGEIDTRESELLQARRRVEPALSDAHASLVDGQAIVAYAGLAKGPDGRYYDRETGQPFAGALPEGIDKLLAERPGGRLFTEAFVSGDMSEVTEGSSRDKEPSKKVRVERVERGLRKTRKVDTPTKRTTASAVSSMPRRGATSQLASSGAVVGGEANLGYAAVSSKPGDARGMGDARTPELSGEVSRLSTQVRERDRTIASLIEKIAAMQCKLSTLEQAVQAEPDPGAPPKDCATSTTPLDSPRVNGLATSLSRPESVSRPLLSKVDSVASSVRLPDRTPRESEATEAEAAGRSAALLSVLSDLAGLPQDTLLTNDVLLLQTMNPAVRSSVRALISKVVYTNVPALRPVLDTRALCAEPGASTPPQGLAPETFPGHEPTRQPASRIPIPESANDTDPAARGPGQPDLTSVSSAVGPQSVRVGPTSGNLDTWRTGKSNIDLSKYRLDDAAVNGPQAEHRASMDAYVGKNPLPDVMSLLGLLGYDTGRLQVKLFDPAVQDGPAPVSPPASSEPQAPPKSDSPEQPSICDMDSLDTGTHGMQLFTEQEWDELKGRLPPRYLRLLEERLGEFGDALQGDNAAHRESAAVGMAIVAATEAIERFRDAATQAPSDISSTDHAGDGSAPYSAQANSTENARRAASAVNTVLRRYRHAFKIEPDKTLAWGGSYTVGEVFERLYRHATELRKRLAVRAEVRLKWERGNYSKLHDAITYSNDRSVLQDAPSDKSVIVSMHEDTRDTKTSQLASAIAEDVLRSTVFAPTGSASKLKARDDRRTSNLIRSFLKSTTGSAASPSEKSPGDTTKPSLAISRKRMTPKFSSVHAEATAEQHPDTGDLSVNDLASTASPATGESLGVRPGVFVVSRLLNSSTTHGNTCPVLDKSPGSSLRTSLKNSGSERSEVLRATDAKISEATRSMEQNADTPILPALSSVGAVYSRKN